MSKLLMEDIYYLEVQLLHYNHYVVVYLEDNFLVVQTVQAVVAFVDWEDIHDNLGGLQVERERLVH